MFARQHLGGRGVGQRRPTRLYFHCHQPNHTRVRCFKQQADEKRTVEKQPISNYLEDEPMEKNEFHNEPNIAENQQPRRHQQKHRQSNPIIRETIPPLENIRIQKIPCAQFNPTTSLTTANQGHNASKISAPSGSKNTVTADNSK